MNKLIVLLACVLLMSIGMASMKPATQKPPRNLKVLPQNISDDSLYAIMESYEKALGVKCGFCHVMKDKNGLEDYASDSLRHKEQCRDMMRMTLLINRAYFPTRAGRPYREKVSCNTCHRGKPEPEER